MRRTFGDVSPTDVLYCTLGDHTAPAAEFATRQSDPQRSGPSYRAYCKKCHRERNGRTSAGLARTGNPRVPRDPIVDNEVQAALGVLRDARAQRRKLAQGYVYLISDGTAVKVGYSVKPEARVAELQTGNPRELLLLAKKEGTEATEATLHTRFIEDNLILEWFRPSTTLLRWFGVRWDTDKRLAWMKNARRKP